MIYCHDEMGLRISLLLTQWLTIKCSTWIFFCPPYTIIYVPVFYFCMPKSTGNCFRPTSLPWDPLFASICLLQCRSAMNVSEMDLQLANVALNPRQCTLVPYCNTNMAERKVRNVVGIVVKEYKRSSLDCIFCLFSI